MHMYVVCAAAGSDKLEMILGILIGAVLALCCGVLLFIARKNPERAKKMWLSFVRMCLGICCLTCAADCAIRYRGSNGTSYTLRYALLILGYLVLGVCNPCLFAEVCNTS